MKIERVVKTLKALRRLHSLLGRGESFLISDVHRVSKLSRATTYRYLKQLNELGHVAILAKPYRGGFANGYALTQKGYDFLTKENE